MRPFTPIKTAGIAACACAALSLSLLAPVEALASAAANPFGGVAQSPANAAKPVTGAGATGAGKTTTSAAKPSVAQTAASKKALLEAVQRSLKSKTAATTTTGTETSAAQESKTSTPMILALVAGVLVLGGIAFVIVRDARSVAPVVEGVTGGTRNPEGRLRKRRAQAKAARRQRKRHRRR